MRKSLFYSTFVIPGSYVLDRSGVLISTTMDLFGNLSNKKRMVYIPEDILVHLQLETAAKIGRDKTEKLYYSAGIDMGRRLLALSHIGRLPRFMVKPVIRKIFTVCSAHGANSQQEIVFSGDRVIITGKDNIVCRKTGMGGLFAGIVAGTLAPILGRKVVARKTHCCHGGEYCRIVMDLLDSKNEMALPEVDEGYYQNNFSESPGFVNRVYSLGDLIRFRKVTFDAGKLSLMDEVLLPFEIGLLGILHDYYRRNGLKSLFSESISSSAGQISSSWFRAVEEDSITFTQKLFSVLGFGELVIDIEDMTATFIRCPYSKYSPDFLVCMLEGFLASALGRSYKISNMAFDPLSCSYKLTYSRKQICKPEVRVYGCVPSHH